MAENVQPDAGEQREESSGLLLSVDPLQSTDNYKLSGDDGSDKGGLLGDDGSDADGSDSSDADGSDGSGADGSDSALGGDSSDADGSDASDADGSDASDADGSDAGGIASDSDETDEQMNPLGIGETNVDGTSADTDGTDAK